MGIRSVPSIKSSSADNSALAVFPDLLACSKRGTRSEIFPRFHVDFLIVPGQDPVDVRTADPACDQRTAHPAEEFLDSFVDLALVELQRAGDVGHPPRVPETHPQNDLIF